MGVWIGTGHDSLRIIQNNSFSTHLNGRSHGLNGLNNSEKFVFILYKMNEKLM